MIRYCVHFFVIGALLLTARLTWRETERREAVVRVAVDANPSEVERACDEAILLAEARRYGWHRSDPVVFQHLVRNMRFVEARDDDDPLMLFEQALALGMDQTDPVVRSRLLHRARQSLGSIPPDRLPTEQALQAHALRHREHFATSPRFEFVHVFLSKDRRGDQLFTDAQRVLGDLQRAPLSPEEAQRLGDPLLESRALETGSLKQLGAKYGSAFGEGIERAPLNRWFGPLESVYGLHLVQVTARVGGALPPLADIRNQVRSDLVREIKDQVAHERLVALRGAYDVRVERAP